MAFTIQSYRRFLPLFHCSGVWSLITILLLSVEPVDAEWVDVGGKVEEGLTVYTVYVDPDTIRRNGDVVTLWALFDYKTIQSIVGGPWLSSKARREYDCVKERVRLLGFTTFSGNMGSGEAVYSNLDETKWEPVAPDSLDRNLWEVACSMK
ncbi:MAG TPA: surface-adhesin E family protein [Nitrospira sp.]|nr:surface-adhesin E family protein [Nitrospira sp.]